jgi:hypothetical protein
MVFDHFILLTLFRKKNLDFIFLSNLEELGWNFIHLPYSESTQNFYFLFGKLDKRLLRMDENVSNNAPFPTNNGDTSFPRKRSNLKNLFDGVDSLENWRLNFR